MLKYKNITKTVALSCLLFLTFISLVSFFGDASCLFHKKDTITKATQLLTEGKTISNIINLNERKMQVELSKIKHNKIDVLILGSSRSMGLSQNIFEGYKVWNGSVSGATLQDIIAFYSIHTKSQDISTLIIGIDPWIFNKNNGMDRWKIVSDQYSKFMNLNNPHTKNKLNTTIINFDYFYTSLRSIFKDTDLKIINNKDIYSTQTDLILPDGSRIYGTKARDKTREEIDQLANAYAKANPIYALGDFKEIDEELRENFIYFIDKVSRNKINIYFWLPPYHPIVFNEIKENKKYKTALEVEKMIRIISEEYSIPIIGSYDPQHNGLSSEFFIDGMHLNYKGYIEAWKDQKLAF